MRYIKEREENMYSMIETANGSSNGKFPLSVAHRDHEEHQYKQENAIRDQEYELSMLSD
jgi:hypothetical protein